MDVTQWTSELEKSHVSQHIISINEQRGSFRDVSEGTLLEELANGSSAIDEQNELLSDGEDDGAAVKAAEDIQKHKAEALYDVDRAHTESAFGRDFVSFLLTKNPTSQAQLTISQPLKERVPLGSIGDELAQLEAPNGDQENLFQLTTGGLELEAFNTTIDSIVAAVETFEKEVQLETRYWRDVVKVKELGWSVVRMPGDGQGLGVRVGCLESGTGYRSKGLVKLKRSQDGLVTLGLADDVARGRILRVRVFHKGAVLATSRTLSAGLPPQANSLERDLLQARDSLFDEELFHELSREAGQLWNRGIKFTTHGIVMPVEKDIELVMDLVNSEESEELSLDSDGNLKERFLNLPDVAAASLRILLCHSHRRSRYRRAALPRPLTGKQLSRQVPSLLLPLACQLQNQVASREIGQFIRDAQSLLAKAKLDTTVKTTDSAEQITQLLSQSENPHQRPLVEQLTSLLSSPAPSSFDMTFSLISVKVSTMFRSHAGGSEYRYLISERPDDSMLARMPADMLFSSIDEVKEAVIDIIRVCLVEIVQKTSDGQWRSATPQTGELQKKKASAGEETQILRINLSQSALCVEIFKGSQHESSPVKTWLIDLHTENSINLMEQLRFAVSTGE